MATFILQGSMLVEYLNYQSQGLQHFLKLTVMVHSFLKSGKTVRSAIFAFENDLELDWVRIGIADELESVVGVELHVFYH